MLSGSQARAAFEKMPEAYAPLTGARWLMPEDCPPDRAAGWRPVPPDPRALALIQFTSGSTGDPRGVMLTHGNILANLDAVEAGWGHPPGSVMVTWLPIFHDMGLLYAMLQPLAGGFPCVMMPPAAFLQRPARWLQAIARYRGTHSAGPNFAYDLCEERIAPAERNELDLSCWRIAVNAAEPVRADTMDRFARAFAPCGFGRRAFAPAFGLAEATLKVTTGSGAAGLTASCGVPAAGTSVRIVDPESLEERPPSTSDRRASAPAFGLAEAALRMTTGSTEAGLTASCGVPAADTTVRVVGPESREERPPSTSDRRASAPAVGLAEAGLTASCGVPAAGTSVRIVDPESLEERPPATVGEIWVCGPAVASGYWRNAQATAAAFGGRIAGCADGPFLRTGDLGVLSNGELFVTGRLKDLIIVNGRNYYPLDIARTVEDCHAALERAGTAAVGVETAGSEALALICEVRRTALRGLNAEEIFEAIRRAVAGDHGLPVASITLIKPKSLPKTSSGKIQHGVCRAQVLARTLDVVAEWRAEPAVRPSRPESEIAAWLAKRLASHTGGSAFSFSSHGLESADAVAIALELEQWLGTRVEPTLFYDCPSIPAMARKLAGEATEPARGETRSGAAPLAIVGMACRFPGAHDCAEYWQLLRSGTDAIGPTPASRAAEQGQIRGGFLKEVDRFDAGFFGISPREADRLDPQQRLMLELAWEGLEDAAIPAERLAGARAGVFVGVSNSDYARLMVSREPAGIYLGTGGALSIIANRISYALDLRGPSLAVDTACSSSLVALSLACHSLRGGECDVALAGGVNLILSPEYTAAFAKANMLAADGRCKVFDADADGYVRSEGGGLVVLKRLDDAVAAGDRVLAVVRGVAVGQDGRTTGLTAPNGPAQSAVIRQALADAGLPASRLSYIEAHGTGTALGDPIEVQALNAVLGERAEDIPVWAGSVKSNIGHLESAAGMAGLIKVVLALGHGRIPQTLHVRTLNPRLGLERGPLRIATAGVAWNPAGETRVAGVSSFGFGGTNAHAIVEEYVERTHPAAGRADREDQLLALSAHSAEALRDRQDQWSAALARCSASEFQDLCFTANTGRSHMRYRVAVTAREAAEASRALPIARPGTPIDGRSQPSIVFAFTGNGAEYPEMGAGLYAAEPVFREAIDRCSEIAGMPLSAPLDTGGLSVSQPAIFALEYALSRLWASWGIVPAAVIGHSLGEYAAACVAGSLSLEDAILLTRTRGRLLAGLSADAAMVAARAPRAVVEQAIAPWPELAIAAVNGPEQVVFSGPQARVLDVAERLHTQGVHCAPLPVARAFHSPAIDPMLDEFEAEAALTKPKPASIPLISSLTGDWKPEAPTAAYWARQMREPVLFAAGIARLQEAGHRHFVELGPHPVLAALGERFFSGGGSLWTASLHRGERPHQRLLASLGKLWERGVSVDWARLEQGRGRRKVAAPPYPFQRQRHWIASAQAPEPEMTPRLCMRWIEQPGGGAARTSGTWILFTRRGDEQQARLGVQLAALLRAAGAEVETLDGHADPRPLLERAAGLIFLAAIAGERGLSAEALNDALEHGPVALLAIAQALLGSGSRARLWIVTSGAQSTGAPIPDGGLLQSPLWGMGKTFALEHPEAWGGLVDVDPGEPDRWAGQVAAELCNHVVQNGEDHVAYRGGIRLVARVDRAPASSRPPTIGIRPEATYLISGGLGDLGSAIASALAAGGARHLILAGRQGANTAGRRAAVRELESLGTQVEVLTVDVGDRDALTRQVREVAARMPPLRGVIHAAGLPGFTPIREMTPQELLDVLRPKIAGALALRQAAANVDLDFFLCTSSLTGTWGAARQAHYVAANHFLDQFASRPGVLSIGLPPIEGGMLPPAALGDLRRIGLTPWSLDRAAQAVLQAIREEQGHVVAARIDWRRYATVLQARGHRAILERMDTAGPAGPVAPAALIERLNAEAPAKRERLLIAEVIREAAAVLGMNSGEWPDLHRGFFDLGMDSLTALELKNRLEAAVGLTLPSTLVFDHPSIGALAAYLDRCISGAAEPKALAAAAASDGSPTVPADELAARLEALERLVAQP